MTLLGRARRFGHDALALAKGQRPLAAFVGRRTGLTAKVPPARLVVGIVNSGFAAPTSVLCRAPGETRRERVSWRRGAVGGLVGLGSSTPFFLMPLDGFAKEALPLFLTGLGATLGYFAGYPAGWIVQARTDLRGRKIALTLPSARYADDAAVLSSEPA